MNDIKKITEDLGLLTFLEAIDLDLLMTGMNQAPVDMPQLMRKFDSLRVTVTLVTPGPNKSKVVDTLHHVMNLSLAEAKEIIENPPISFNEFADVDKATAFRDKLNSDGAEAQLFYSYQEGE